MSILSNNALLDYYPDREYSILDTTDAEAVGLFATA